MGSERRKLWGRLVGGARERANQRAGIFPLGRSGDCLDPSRRFRGDQVVKIGKGRKNTILKENYEGRVKSPTRGAPSGHIYKITSNGPENMTKIGRSGKRSSNPEIMIYFQVKEPTYRLN